MPTPSILLTGATSIIGFNLMRLFPDMLTPVCNPFTRAAPAANWERIALEERATVGSMLQKHRPATVLYCHAVCDVTKCQADPAWARLMNVDALDNVLDQLPADVRVVYVSSDHVFGEDGAYFEDSPTCPISEYGHTRVAAEKCVRERPGSLVLRAGLPIGPSIDGKTGHLDWLRYRHERGLPISIVEDEARSAVGVEPLVARIMQLAQSDVIGTRHLPGEHLVSRVALARGLAQGMGITPALKLETRAEQAAPHLGRIEIRSLFNDCYAVALPGPPLPSA